MKAGVVGRGAGGGGARDQSSRDSAVVLKALTRLNEKATLRAAAEELAIIIRVRRGRGGREREQPTTKTAAAAIVLGLWCARAGCTQALCTHPQSHWPLPLHAAPPSPCRRRSTLTTLQRS